MVCAFCQSSVPSTAEQQAILARVRDYALNYGDRLQDFTCLQLTTRSANRTGSGEHWKVLETKEQELSYVAHREHYRLLRVNGDAAFPEARVKRGYTQVSGEFGSSLHDVFDPKSKAELTWDRVEASPEGRSCVFRYHVPVETSSMTWKFGAKVVPVGHSGSIHADCESGMVTRLELKTDLTKVKDVALQSDIQYGLTTIASLQFMVPLNALDISRVQKTITKAEVKFEQYRKYEADSVLTFDGVK